MKEPAIIVAEVSKTWPNPNQEPISSLFEKIINTNRDRGYGLQSWLLSQVRDAESMHETIVAVFGKVER